VDDIRDLERMAACGPEGKEQRRVAFRNMYLTRSHFTEARLQYTEHLTRDVMWQPHMLTHPNGAVGLSHLYLCAHDAAATADKAAPMLGVGSLHVRDGEYVLPLAASELRVVTPAAWSHWAPGTPLPPLPAAVGLGLAVASLPATKTYLAEQGIRFHDGP